MNTEQLRREYEAFFRGGGYRLMRLLVLKAEQKPETDRACLDVVALMRLQHSGETAEEWIRKQRETEISRVSDVYGLDLALRDVLDGLPRGWGMIVDRCFGRGVKTRASGTGIRKRTAENALSGACRAIAEHNGRYDFASEGLAAAGKVMSYLAAASEIGEDISDSFLMRAVTGMKLFRNSREGILYTDSLEEFCERSGARPWTETGAVRMEDVAAGLLIRENLHDGQHRTGLERKVQEGRSSVLIERMYEIYSIMASVKEYLPDKYERIMSFHWTKNQEKLTELFLETAALLAAAQDCQKK